MYDYRQTYAQMSDDELLNVATQTAALVPEAQDALQAELRKRHLSQVEVTQYEHDRALEDAARPIKRPTFTVRGTGTMLYGKRDFAADGSYVTTRWIVLSRIPVVPLASLRVKRLRRWSPFERWNDSYQVVAQTKPAWKQVLFVYAYLLALVGVFYLLLLHGTRLLIATFLLLPVPFILRRYARANNALRDADTNGQSPQAPR